MYFGSFLGLARKKKPPCRGRSASWDFLGIWLRSSLSWVANPDIYPVRALENWIDSHALGICLTLVKYGGAERSLEKEGSDLTSRDSQRDCFCHRTFLRVNRRSSSQKFSATRDLSKNWGSTFRGTDGRQSSHSSFSISHHPIPPYTPTWPSIQILVTEHLDRKSSPCRATPEFQFFKISKNPSPSFQGIVWLRQHFEEPSIIELDHELSAKNNKPVFKTERDNTIYWELKVGRAFPKWDPDK